MKTKLTLICLALSLFAKAQTVEWYNQAYPFYETHQKKIVRTDERGQVIWQKEISEITNDDCGIYIIAAPAKIKNGKIVANPGDYDYWLVSEETLNDSILLCPTLCTDYTTIMVGARYPRDLYLDVFDQNGRLVKLKELHLGENQVCCWDLPNGTYFLTIFSDIETEEKTFRIVVQH